jgi:polyhydroxybutyrate depolymerase
VRRTLTPLLALAAGLAAPAAADGCGGPERPCEIAGGRYYLAVPEHRGETPMPALVFLHGYQSSGAEWLADAAFVRGWTEAGFALVLPDGIDRTWRHIGSPASGRDDLAFLDEVVADLRARLPVGAVWVGGFSQGGSMVWDLACHRPGAWAGFLPVAGAFWQPLPERCAGPVTLRHVHGMGDEVVPMAGRAIRRVFRQGDVLAGWAVLTAAAGPPAGPDSALTQGDQTCRRRTTTAGARLELCLHPGGHLMPVGWIAASQAFIREGG